MFVQMYKCSQCRFATGTAIGDTVVLFSPHNTTWILKKQKTSENKISLLRVSSRRQVILLCENLSFCQTDFPFREKETSFSNMNTYKFDLS